MFLIGNFYHVYGRDADIISYLFDYKIKDVDGVKECGFPISSINKVKVPLLYFPFSKTVTSTE